MPDRILTWHPDGKKRVKIEAVKYRLVRSTISDILKEHTEITYRQLNSIAKDHLESKFEGSIPWYVVTVKLDLEARGIIERIPKTSPHKIKMKQ